MILLTQFRLLTGLSGQCGLWILGKPVLARLCPISRCLLRKQASIWSKGPHVGRHSQLETLWNKERPMSRLASNSVSLLILYSHRFGKAKCYFSPNKVVGRPHLTFDLFHLLQGLVSSTGALMAVLAILACWKFNELPQNRSIPIRQGGT